MFLFYGAFLRYANGAVPTCFLKNLPKEDWSGKLSALATCCIDNSEFCSSACASTASVYLAHDLTGEHFYTGLHVHRHVVFTGHSRSPQSHRTPYGAGNAILFAEWIHLAAGSYAKARPAFFQPVAAYAFFEGFPAHCHLPGNHSGCSTAADGIDMDKRCLSCADDCAVAGKNSPATKAGCAGRMIRNTQFEPTQIFQIGGHKRQVSYAVYAFVQSVKYSTMPYFFSNSPNNFLAASSLLAGFCPVMSMPSSTT